MFDRILLLSDRGETIYFGDLGPDASTIISYFENNGAPACEPDANPAEWVLNMATSQDVSKAESPPGSEGQTMSWAEKWNASQEKEKVVQRLRGINESPRVFQVEDQRIVYATPWSHQLKIVLSRTFRDYWRSPTYVYSKIALCAGVVSSIHNQSDIANIQFGLMLGCSHSSTDFLSRTPALMFKV